jgi:hypothetical protein
MWWPYILYGEYPLRGVENSTYGESWRLTWGSKQNGFVVGYRLHALNSHGKSETPTGLWTIPDAANQHSSLPIFAADYWNYLGSINYNLKIKSFLPIKFTWQMSGHWLPGCDKTRLSWTPIFVSGHRIHYNHIIRVRRKGTQVLHSARAESAKVMRTATRIALFKILVSAHC